MSSGYNLQDIAEFYSKKSDSELILIATENASGLRDGVFDIIETEIIKRNLNPNILEGLKAQNKDYSLAEITQLSQKLRSLPCPFCKNQNVKLNATVLHTVKSYILFSNFKKQLIIACPDCLDSKNQKAITTTLLLGWWGIPWGIVQTPFYIYNNTKEKKSNRIDGPNATFLSFTMQNIGQIVANIENVEKLKLLIISVKK